MDYQVLKYSVGVTKLEPLPYSFHNQLITLFFLKQETCKDMSLSFDAFVTHKIINEIQND